MTAIPRRTRTLQIVLPALSAAIWLVLFVVDLAGIESGRILSEDRALERSVHSVFGLHDFGPFETVTTLGGPVVRTVVVLLIALLLVWRRRWRAALLLVVVVEGAALLSEIVKSAVRRPRPHLFSGALHADGYSFPSGHTIGTFALCAALTVLLWPRIRAAWARAGILLLFAIWVLAVGLSRIVLGVHYPSDVLGAYALGGIWVGCVLAAFARVARGSADEAI